MIYTTKNTIEIGKPLRVFVNGNHVRSAVRADTSRGEVVYCPEPARIKKGTDEIYTRTLRGTVTVEPV